MVYDDYQTRKAKRREFWGELDKRPRCAHVDPVTGQKCRNYLGRIRVNTHRRCTKEYTLCPVHAPKICQEKCADGRRCQALLHYFHVHCYTCQDPNDYGQHYCLSCYH